MSRESDTDWTTPWVRVRLHLEDGTDVGYLRWYAPHDRGLAMLLTGDDPILRGMDSATSVEVAPVRERGARASAGLHQRAALRLLDPSSGGAVRAALSQKYGWRHRLFHPVQWVVRRLGGDAERRKDVPVGIDLLPPAGD